MINILFSTTRQWNPGDEIILKGCINLLLEYGIKFNPVIWNRHPNFRPLFAPHYDNSFDLTRHSFDAIDYVIFAGTPEWQGSRVDELLQIINDTGKPCAFIGIGGGRAPDTDIIRNVLKNQAELIVCRDKSTFENISPYGKINYLHACPSIFHSSSHKQSLNQRINKIGLIFQTTQTMYQDISENQRDFLIHLYHELGKEYEISLIPHYIDEFVDASMIFDKRKIHYSYDVGFFQEIYKEVDFVLGMRLHGCLAALGVGVPSMLLGTEGNYRRLGAIELFDGLAYYGKDDLSFVKNRISEINPINWQKNFIEFKANLKATYLDLFKQTSLKHLQTTSVPINASYKPKPSKGYRIKYMAHVTIKAAIAEIGKKISRIL